MSKTWVPWNPPASQKRTGPHSMTGRFGKKSRISYVYCAHCGLISLNNTVTRQALRRQCEWEE